MKLSTAARNAAADAAVDLIDGAATDGDLYFQNSSSEEVATISFSDTDTAFGSAVEGVATANDTPLSDTDVAGGTISTGTSPYGALIRDGDGTTIFSLTVTSTGGGGDIEISSLNFSAGETLRLDSMTYTQPEGS